MGIFDGVILACDIDGTLMVCGKLPKRNIDAIEYFKSEGGRVCLATGRTATALRPVLSFYNGYCPCVVGNGSMIYDTVNDEILYEQMLDKSEFACVEAAMRLVPGVGIELHSGKHVYKLTETAETVDHQRYEQIEAEPITLEAARELDINKVLYLFDNEEQRQKVKESVLPCSKNSEFFDSDVLLEGKMRIYLEHVSKGVSKSETLLKLIEMLGIKRDKFFAIGDGFNDLEMLKTAAFSACPDGAPDAVKEIAGIIVGSAQNGAVADFIDIIKRRLNNGCKDKT